jgi:transcriptional regulator with XRE-family HTH domain
MAQSIEQVAARLVRTREALGLSQAELCRQIGVESNTWNQYEKAKREIPRETVELLKMRYGVSFDWLYAGDMSRLPKDILDQLFNQAAA